jgi:hypothetical protein
MSRIASKQADLVQDARGHVAHVTASESVTGPKSELHMANTLSAYSDARTGSNVPLRGCVAAITSGSSHT